MERDLIAKKHPRFPFESSDEVRALAFMVAFVLLFCIFAIPMGLANAMNTLMNTAYRLLIDVALYSMSIAVLASAISELFSAYGVNSLFNRLLSRWMGPVYGMPGAAAMCIITTYLSDNPTVLTVTANRQYLRYFRAYQIPALTNLGTSFGMGLVVTTFVLGLGSSVPDIGLVAFCGNLGTIAGSIFSTRLLLALLRRTINPDLPAENDETFDHPQEDTCPRGLMSVLMSGGRKGMELGFGIIPGILIICTLVMMLTNGPSISGDYTGAAYEGIGLLPAMAEKLNFLLKPLFGFSSAAAIAVPVTAMGSTGAALGLIPSLIQHGQATGSDIAVFTAMCMCWSGYLSTHASIMDVLHCPQFTGKAVMAHTIGGLVAGITAHWSFVLIQLIL